VYERFGADPSPHWQQYFENQRGFLETMEKYLSITAEQKANPKIIHYWVGPARLIRRKTKSQPFLKFLDTWFYSETSAQAHLKVIAFRQVGKGEDWRPRFKKKKGRH
jgi:hypothetical protein